MEPALILFDVDGTLVDAAGAGRRALELALETVLGIDGLNALAGGVAFEGKTDPRIVEEMAAAAGVPPDAVHARAIEIRDAYVKSLHEVLARPDPRRRVLPGVVALLDRLRGRPGVYLGLVTGNIEAGARAKLAALGLDGYFPEGGFSSDHPDRREIARLAREKISGRTGVSFATGRVSVVGDTVADIACARANGFRAIAVESGWVTRERLEAARPDALFRDLTDADALLAAFGLV